MYCIDVWWTIVKCHLHLDKCQWFSFIEFTSVVFFLSNTERFTGIAKYQYPVSFWRTSHKMEFIFFGTIVLVTDKLICVYASFLTSLISFDCVELQIIIIIVRYLIKSRRKDCLIVSNILTFTTRNNPQHCLNIILWTFSSFSRVDLSAILFAFDWQSLVESPSGLHFKLEFSSLCAEHEQVCYGNAKFARERWKKNRILNVIKNA